MSESIEQHKYYELAYRAHTGTSFSPEKRAASECAYYDEICEEFRNAGKDSAIEKFTTLFIKSMSAKSRTFSTMISGPANYPVARQEKLRGYERLFGRGLSCFHVTRLLIPTSAPRIFNRTSD